MKGRLNSTRAALSVILVALVLLGVFGFALAMIGVAQAILFVVAVASVALGALGIVTLRRHFTEIERLRGAVAVMQGDIAHRVPPTDNDGAGSELAALHALLGQFMGRLAAERAAPDERLTDVVAAVGGGLLVITEIGLVSLINDAARDLLGERGTVCGTSVYDVFTRHSLVEAKAQATSARHAVDVDLQTVDGRTLRARFAPLARYGGAVVWFDGAKSPTGHHVELALDLHDLPPPVTQAEATTLLSELSAIVMDTETTGLDVYRDRIVSFGSVRVHGTRIYRAATQDLLVNPGMAIPKRSIAVHGITDAMAAGAPELDRQWPAIEAALKDLVVVGHNIGFDAVILAREAERIGVPWQPVPLIDTLLLAAALDPARRDLTLDGLAAEFGIPIEGRHTALGDALVTAELYVRLIDSLAERGIVTLDQAIKFGAGRSDLVREQKERGWLTPQPI